MRRYRRRSQYLVPLLAIPILFLSFLCAATSPTTSQVDRPSPTSSSALIGRIRTLRARLRAVRDHRRNLDRERFTLESSITSAREHIELSRLRDARRSVDNTDINDLTSSSNSSATHRDLLEVNALISAFESKKQELDRAIALLTVEANRLAVERQVTLARLQAISLEDIFFSSHVSSSLPPVMQGALRKSAHVLTPFFDTLVTAADTNDRLVNHVGAEIDKYTHMGIRASPFMSGMLFYCVALIPALTLVLLVRTFIDSSTKWSVSHFIVFANIYFILSCIIMVFASILQPHNNKYYDPLKTLYERYEKPVIVCNLIMPLYYCWFVGTLFIETIDQFERRNLAQLVAASAVGIHYFVFAWSKIFTDKHPHLLTSNYLVYATIFMFITYERCLQINARWFTKSSLMRYMRSLDYTLSYSKISIVLPAITTTIWNKMGKNLCLLFDQLQKDVIDLWHRCRRWANSRRKSNNTRRSTSHRKESRYSTRSVSRGSLYIGSTTWNRGRKLSIFSRNAAASEYEADSGDESLSCSDSEDDLDTKSKESERQPLLVRLRNAIFHAR